MLSLSSKRWQRKTILWRQQKNLAENGSRSIKRKNLMKKKIRKYRKNQYENMSEEDKKNTESKRIQKGIRKIINLWICLKDQTKTLSSKL